MHTYMNKGKSIILFSGGEEGLGFSLTLKVYSETKVFSGSWNFKFKETREKDKVRGLDRKWCYRNIPSSIMWNVEVHHDWENGGTMYLLSHAEHMSIHRKG